MNQDKSEQEEYNELSYYTLAHVSPDFIHQHIVDVYAAQTADENTKPIKLAFALIGLYLFLEKNYSGKEVQQAHAHLAKQRKQWPMFDLPTFRGEITVSDVVNVPPGEKRDEMIRRWCVSVWQAFSKSHKKIAGLV